MGTPFKSGASLVAATVVVFAVIYAIDDSGDLKPLQNAGPMPEIRGSVGPVTPIVEGRSTEDDAGANKDPEKTSVRSQCDAWARHRKELETFGHRASSAAEQERIRQSTEKVRQKMRDLDCTHG